MTTIQYGYGSISLGDVLTELRTTNPGRGYPISLGDADVRALAGIPSGPISLTDLYGRSVAAPLTATGNNDYGYDYSGGMNGTVRAYPSVTVSGGTGTRTFVWSILSSSGSATLSNASAQQCTVSRNFPKGSQGRVLVYLRCVVSDSTGSVTIDNIVADLTWDAV